VTGVQTCALPILVEFSGPSDTAVNASVLACAAALRADALPAIRDIVPTLRSVAVYIDPLQIAYDELVRRIEASVEQAEPIDTSDGHAIEVPVVYGGAYGPDLQGVAALAGLTESAVVALHVARTYRVFMLGFMPGFAYMGVVDERIAVPRLPVPRVKVPAGSVAVAGTQTAIYPFDAPGGWQILGRTPLRPYEPARAEPFLFSPGDTVRFVPVDQWPS
jgi:inhibitor of KinA